MKLKAVYEAQEDIPEQYTELFSERNGQWELTGIEGIKTEADTKRQLDANRKLRDEVKGLKETLSKFDGIDADKFHEQIDELEELRARVESGGGKADEEAIQKRIDAAVQRKLAPVERERDKFKGELESATGKVSELTTSIQMSKIERAVVKAAQDAKVVPSAYDDVLLRAQRLFEVTDDGAIVTKDQVGVTPGIDPAVWLSEIQPKASHWWGTTVGGGANGNLNGSGSAGASNPFSKAGWNKTKQGDYIREHGEDKAAQAARSAGFSDLDAALGSGSAIK